MKNFFLVTYILCVLAYAGFAGAQGSAVTPTVSKESAVVQAPAPAPVPAPAVENPGDKLKVKDEALVPPNWLQDMVIAIKKLPVIGPVLTVALQWLGVIATILTALVAFLLVSIRALTTVLTSMKLVEIANKLVAFQDGKIMYWLKYLSVFNAQKKEEEKSDRSAA